MSYSSWHNYGYGICTDNLEINSIERIESLLELAPQYQKKLHEWLADCEVTEPTVDDYLDFDVDYHQGIATILCEVIHEAENILFLACDDEDGYLYLIYPPSYPWQLPKQEQDITEETVVRILSKYVTIISDTAVDIEYQSVENGG